MSANLNYIKQVHLNDIPWNLLSTPYSRAGEFPAWFKELNGENAQRVANAAREIALNIEHQSTLWQVTPFAMIILDRLLSSAIDKYQYTKDEADKTIIRHIMEIYVPVFETVDFMLESTDNDLPDPLPLFSDMLAPEYLLPTVEELDGDDEDELEAYLEMQYMEMPEELFYSFFHYSWMVLAFSLNKNTYKLIEINDMEINGCLDVVRNPEIRDFMDRLMYE